MADAIDEQNAGVYIYLKKIIENIRKEDRENQYIFIHKRRNPFFKNSTDLIIPKKNTPLYGTYRKFYLIPKAIRKLSPDIVWEPCHIGLFNLPKTIKKVLTIHDTTPIKFPQFHIKRSSIIHKIFFKRVIKNADLILTNSKTSKQDILNYQKTKAKIRIIPLGSDPDQKNHPKPMSEPYILYLGTIEPRKNLDTLIEAYQQLNIPHKLVLAGPQGWKCQKTIDRAKQNPNIILTGYLSEEEKAAYYQHSSLFIFPSIYEGFGLPVLEAMSYGIPVICSDNSSLEEIFKNKALLFPAQDQNKLAELISKVLKNDKLSKNLSQKGKSYSKKFSWKKSAQKTLQALLS